MKGEDHRKKGGHRARRHCPAPAYAGSIILFVMTRDATLACQGGRPADRGPVSSTGHRWAWAGYPAAMADSELVVDLRGRPIRTLADFWDAVAEPCGLPARFGRNLDAWSDTIHARGISEVIDRHDTLVVHVDQRGLFEGSRCEAQALADLFDGEQNQLVVHASA